MPASSIRPLPFPSVSVVIPVYNGSATVGDVVSRCKSVLGDCTERREFILVNDGSADDSWERITELSAADRTVRGIDLARNYGQHNALLAGIRDASGDLIVTIDDDLQNPPEEIPKLLERLDKGCDVVYGVPIAKQQNIGRRLATRAVVGFLSALGGRTAPMVSSFRAFRTNLRDGFADYTGPDVSIDGLLTWRTERFCSVPVRHDQRAHGESNYSLMKLARHALTMVTAFSTRPLRIATTLGFMVTLFGIVVLLYVVGRFIGTGHSVPGFPFLASIISIFSGAQLFAIGVIGEYLARMHVRVMSRPSYSIQARTDDREEVARADQAHEQGTSRGDDLCRLLAWDTEFWGFPVGRVTVDSLDRSQALRVQRWCEVEGVRCAYLLADGGDAKTAAAAAGVGFEAVDTRVTLVRSAEAEPPIRRDSAVDIREAKSSDEEQLTAIARSSHTDTRFFFDPRFPREKAQELYATWVRNGLGDDSGSLLVADQAGLLVGYVLLGKDPFRIDLIAVADSARGRGVGEALVSAAIQHAAGVAVQVVTQARNIAALRLYQRTGFEVVKTEVWYHRWT
ncbi:MAG: GNAT family N-acetyltransferase [Solirubrobacterales bacterium]